MYTIDSEPFLTRYERESPLWRRLAEHMRAELERQRIRNDGIRLDEVQTAVIRGHIAQLKSLLALGDEPQALGDVGGPV